MVPVLNYVNYLKPASTMVTILNGFGGSEINPTFPSWIMTNGTDNNSNKIEMNSRHLSVTYLF
jgi:hypothetical protein